MFLEEATISKMWEIATLVKILERKGFCTKQDLHIIIDDLRRKNPRARIPETAFLEPYLLTETENQIIDDIRLDGIIEMGQGVEWVTMTLSLSTISFHAHNAGPFQGQAPCGISR